MGANLSYQPKMPLKLGKEVGYPAIKDATGETLIVSSKSEREFMAYLVEAANAYHAGRTAPEGERKMHPECQRLGCQWFPTEDKP